MNQERLLTILLGPVTSEKSSMVADKNNQVVFKVLNNATKPEVKQAVEKLFNVKVDNVSTCNVKGKKKRFGQRLGVRKSWKKAYVRLSAGHDINFADFAS